jgi:V/A-type H+-transporting ATPase subunit I
MSLFRSLPTTWFEILAPRVECARSLGNLARSGAVQIEIRSHNEALLNVNELSAGLDNYRNLYKSYHRYWARGVLRHAPSVHSPLEVLNRALTGITHWEAAANTVIDDLQEIEQEYLNLGYCQRFLQGLKNSEIDLNLTKSAGPLISLINAIFTPGTEFDSKLPYLSVNVLHEDDTCFMAVTSQEYFERLITEIKAANGRIVILPNWLKGNAEAALSDIIQRKDWLKKRIDKNYEALDRLYEKFKLAEVLGDVTCLEWFLKNVGTLEPAGANLVWITGWVIPENKNALGEILMDAGVPALVHFPDPPAGFDAPQLLKNPWWSKPFELFARAFGTPGYDEFDPSPLLAIIVPLMFGYMFADVGQGLVLVIAGIVLKQRWSGAGLIINAGVSATLFGFLFGSLFSYETLIPALWLHPLHEPLLTLLIPLFFGAFLLLLGQALHAVESFWQGQLKAWALQHGGLFLVFLGGLAGLYQRQLWLIALIGVVWYMIGNAWYKKSVLMLLGSAAKLLEDTVRLLVNTVSFARVGAFALAHAGLSSAIVALSESSGSIITAVVIMVLGNVLIILLEGLVVSIQTTRLILFEFFIRFFHGTGRIFKPLASPPEVMNVPPSSKQ